MLRAKRRGFTLIELLVVVVIIGILASIGVGAYNQAMDRSRNGGVISNVRAVFLGIEQWKTDHPGLPVEIIGDDHNKHLAAKDGVSPDTFPMKYVSGGKLPPAPWSRPPQGVMDSVYNATEGATSGEDGDTLGATPAAEVFKKSEGEAGGFNLSDGFFADGGGLSGAPPPPGTGPSQRSHYGYIYYLGETGSSRYAVLGVGKNKKRADVITVRANFQ